MFRSPPGPRLTFSLLPRSRRHHRPFARGQVHPRRPGHHRHDPEELVGHHPRPGWRLEHVHVERVRLGQRRGGLGLACRPRRDQRRRLGQADGWCRRPLRRPRRRPCRPSLNLRRPTLPILLPFLPQRHLSLFDPFPELPELRFSLSQLTSSAAAVHSYPERGNSLDFALSLTAVAIWTWGSERFAKTIVHLPCPSRAALSRRSRRRAFAAMLGSSCPRREAGSYDAVTVARDFSPSLPLLSSFLSVSRALSVTPLPTRDRAESEPGPGTVRIRCSTFAHQISSDRSAHCRALADDQ